MALGEESPITGLFHQMPRLVCEHMLSSKFVTSRFLFGSPTGSPIKCMVNSSYHREKVMLKYDGILLTIKSSSTLNDNYFYINTMM